MPIPKDKSKADLWRKRQSEAQKGHPGWNKGKKMSTETRKRMSISAKKKFNNGYVNPMKGKKLSKRRCEILSRIHKGKKISEEQKIIVSKKLKGVKRPPEKYPAYRTKKFRENLRIHRINNPMRKFSNTSIEKKMAKLLDELGIKYFQNYPLDNIANVDFYIPNKKIVIECDGCYWHGCPIHYPDNDKRVKRDNETTKLLIKKGYKVYRFWEHEINSNNFLKIWKKRMSLSW